MHAQRVFTRSAAAFSQATLSKLGSPSISMLCTFHSFVLLASAGFLLRHPLLLHHLCFRFLQVRDMPLELQSGQAAGGDAADQCTVAARSTAS